MSDKNYPLFIGIALLLPFLILAILGPTLAPSDPMYVNKGIIQVDGASIAPTRQPVPPFRFPSLFLLGTDDAGRDIFSRVLWAIRPTLLLCATIVTVRMLIGMPLGLISGWKQGWATQFIETATSICLSVPTLVFAIAAISFMGAEKGLLAFIVALSLTGWSDTAAFVRSRTMSIRQSHFIESARAIGLRPWRLLRKHVLPQLWPVIPSLLAYELGGVLLLITELGFLGIYIGGGFIYYVDKGDSLDSWVILTAGYPELGQMLSKVWAKLILTPWEPIIVGTLVFLIIFSFNMLGEGLRRRMDITRL